MKIAEYRAMREGDKAYKVEVDGYTGKVRVVSLTLRRVVSRSCMTNGTLRLHNDDRPTCYDYRHTDCALTREGAVEAALKRWEQREAAALGQVRAARVRVKALRKLMEVVP